MSLDLATVVLLSALNTLMMSFALFSVRRHENAGLDRGLRHWAYGVVLQPAVWLLIALADRLPFWLSPLLANFLLVVALGEFYRAFCMVTGAARPPRWVFALPVFELCGSVLITQVFELLPVWHEAWTAAFLCGLLGMSAVRLWRSRGKPWLDSDRLCFAVFTIGTAILLARALTLVLIGSGLTDGVQGDFGLSMSVFFQSLPMIATLGIALMAKDRLQTELERLAAVDPLTGVANRRSFEAEAERTLLAAGRRKMSVSLLLIDADHFKRVNDRYGHEVGDNALLTIVTALKGSLRASDLLGRYGGEEFAALLPDADQAAAMHVAERLRAAVEISEFAFAEHPIPLRVSIGVATVTPEQGESKLNSLLRHADLALYAAKAAGRNRVQAG
ncbi:MAG: GGDEF domain-containing protein [Ahniella sp.]|nr:GGDEF domain-containing protein [Ahniella sp.]